MNDALQSHAWSPVEESVLRKHATLPFSERYQPEQFVVKSRSALSVTHPEEVVRVMQLPDGRILSRSRHAAHLWSEAGEHLHSFQGLQGWLNCLIQLKDGRFASAAGLKGLFEQGAEILIHRSDGSLIRRFREDRLWNVRSLCELSDGRLLSYSDDNKLRFWTLDGECLISITTFNSHGYSKAFEVSGRRLATIDTAGGVLRTLDGNTITKIGDCVNARGLLELNDGRFLIWSLEAAMLCSSEGSLLRSLERTWPALSGAVELSNDEERWIRRRWNSGITGAAQLPGGRLITWDLDTLKLLEPTGESIKIMEGHVGRVRGVQALADDGVMSWGTDGLVCLWSAGGDLLGAWQCPFENGLEISSTQIGQIFVFSGNQLQWLAIETRDGQRSVL
jgi:WD40 repeat protein